MTSFGKIGKYLIYIQNLLYILCFIKILFSLFSMRMSLLL